MKVTDIVLILSADHWKEIPELERSVLFYSNDSEVITVPRVGDRIATDIRFCEYVEEKLKIDYAEYVEVYHVTFNYIGGSVDLHVKPCEF